MDESTISFSLKNISLYNNYLGIFTKIDLEKLNINTYKNFITKTYPHPLNCTLGKSFIAHIIQF